MNLFEFLIILSLLTIADYISIIVCIKQNKYLFYDMYRERIEKVLKKEGLINDN